MVEVTRKIEIIRILSALSVHFLVWVDTNYFLIQSYLDSAILNINRSLNKILNSLQSFG